MHIVRVSHFWQFGSITSLATETTDGEILVAFLAHTWPQKQSQSVLFSQTPIACSHLKVHAIAVPV